MDGGQQHYGRDSRSIDDTLGIEGYSGAAPIGHGGFGLVFKASQLAFGREVAVKVLAAPLKDESVKKRFERECKAIGALSGHPHIVTVYESGIDDYGRPFIAMDFMPGGSFSEYVFHGGPLPWQEVLAMGIKLAGAVATAHRAGILHRDIKPENILLSGYGEPKLADFGISTVPGAYQTHSGVITASLTHAAPEILGGETATEASDVYSLASTLFFLLRGRPPFSLQDDEPLPSLIARILTHPIPDLRRSGVPDAVCSVLERALAKDPTKRHESAEAFAAALQEVEAAHGLRVTDVPLVTQQVWVQGSAPEGGPRPGDAPASPVAAVAPAVLGNATKHRQRRELVSPAAPVRTSWLTRGRIAVTAAGVAAVIAAAGVFAWQDGAFQRDTSAEPAAARRAAPAASPTPNPAAKPQANRRPRSKKKAAPKSSNRNAKHRPRRQPPRATANGSAQPNAPRPATPTAPVVNPPSLPKPPAPPVPKPKDPPKVDTPSAPAPPTTQPAPQQPIPSAPPAPPVG